MTLKDPVGRFWSMVDTSGECWEWSGPRHPLGYGYCYLSKGHSRYAHRASWELSRGPIPKGYQIDHLCRNPPCVNPEHLDVVTPRENTARSSNPAGVPLRTGYCQRGHEQEIRNVYVKPDGGRSCRPCRAAAKPCSDATADRILAFVAEFPNASLREIGAVVEMNPGTVGRAIRFLQGQGRVVVARRGTHPTVRSIYRVVAPLGVAA